MTSLAKTSLALCLGALALAGSSQAFAEEPCLRISDIQDAHPDNPMSMTVHTTSGAFLVTFTSECPAYMQHQHFVWDPAHYGTCLKPHDPLTTNEHVACFVKSIKPL